MSIVTNIVKSTTATVMDVSSMVVTFVQQMTNISIVTSTI